MIVLGIETSCDETSAALVNDERAILSNVVLSQLDDHRPYGGVVPEIAARAHLDHLPGLIYQALKEAGLSWSNIDGVAATAGPGLIGGVMVGLMMAKGIAMSNNIPFAAVNHLEGHALTPRLTDDVIFPYLLLLMSGGHTQIVLVQDVGQYRLLGTTIDDAVGEAFDKVAKMLGLGYPGGPLMEQWAHKEGNEEAHRFNTLPRPLKGRQGCDFSFSGLKTAARKIILEEKRTENDADKAAFARAFHEAVGDVLEDRILSAYISLQKEGITPSAVVVAGGVAANRLLGQRLKKAITDIGGHFIMPDVSLCTDNAAMIAWAGMERLQRQLTDSWDARARPRWPLEEINA